MCRRVSFMIMVATSFGTMCAKPKQQAASSEPRRIHEQSSRSEIRWARFEFQEGGARKHTTVKLGGAPSPARAVGRSSTSVAYQGGIVNRWRNRPTLGTGATTGWKPI